MCGICGFNRKDENLCKSMIDTLKHRGPDDEGFYFDENVSLGHRRLSIIDLALGHQPIYNEDKSICIVYNGEIYNYKEIRKELENKHKFYTNSDTEVIIHAYEEYSFECVKKFNGMWAFCIYDKNKNLLFLSRDRFGIKPLYYHFDGKNFIFASEIKAILQHNVKRIPNDMLIFDCLFYNIVDHTNETFFKGINKVPKGNSAIFNIKEKTLKMEKYWEIKVHKEDNENTSTSVNKMDEIKDIFFDSVKLRLRSDVPVGSCLSGGIDSSSIVCAVAKLTDGENTHNLNTFSAVFPGKEIDESKYIEAVVENTSVKPNFVSPSGEKLMKDLMDLIYYQEEPLPGVEVYTQFQVMKLAREKGLKVLLDGQGGDEILAGYLYFFGYYFKELLKKGELLTLIKEMMYYYKKHKRFYEIGMMLYLFLPYSFKRYIFKRENKYVNKSFINKYLKKSTYFRDFIDANSLNDSLLKHFEYKLEHLLKYEDRNSMAFSIETRLPFLDYRLVEFLFSLQSSLKIKNGETKFIFREAMKGILPNEILERQDKLGFATPVNEWIKLPEVSEFIENIINSKSFEKRGYFDVNYIKKLFHNKDKRRFIWSNCEFIWKVVLLELWFRMFIDKQNEKQKFTNYSEQFSA